MKIFNWKARRNHPMLSPLVCQFLGHEAGRVQRQFDKAVGAQVTLRVCACHEANGSDLLDDLALVYTISWMTKAAIRRQARLPADVNRAALDVRATGRVGSLASVCAVRTMNVLRKRGAALGFSEDSELSELRRLTFGDLAEHFDALSIIDLLTALDMANEASSIGANPEPVPLDEGSRALLLSLRDDDDAVIVLRDDPRFGVHVRAIDADAANLRDAAEAALGRSGRPEALKAAAALAVSLPAARRATLADEVQQLARAAVPKNVEELITRLYYTEPSRPELEGVGKRFGQSKQRMQQVEAKFRQGMKVVRAYAPVVDQVVKLIELGLTLTALEFQSRLQVLCGTAACPSPSSLKDILCGVRRGPAVCVVSIGAGQRVLTGQDAECVTATLKAARALGRRNIAVSVDQLIEKAGASVSPEQATGLVRRVIEECDEFRWLDAERNWCMPFSVDASPCALLTSMKKALAVGRRLSVGNLLAAVRRHQDLQWYDAPTEILAEVCRHLPFCRVEGELVIALDSLRWEDVASPREQQLIRILMASGRPVPYRLLVALCQGEIEPASLSPTLSTSPIFESTRWGEWRLIGPTPPKNSQDMAA